MKYLALMIVFALPATVRAGLYYSGEVIAELPAQWRGFLLDQRGLRALAVKPAPGLPDSPLRADYTEALARLEKKSAPDAEDLADLGALYLRLGQPGRAVEVLRNAQRLHQRHFRIAANLGSAWQLNGDLEVAATALRQALRLAPDSLRPIEELHLKLVEARLRQKDKNTIDDLFGVAFGDGIGSMPDAERRKLPGSAVALVQRLALMFPTDGRLLWQLGELANAAGDVRTAAAIFEGCVTEFGLTGNDHRRRRQLFRDAAERLGPASRTDSGSHDGHAGMAFRSTRPLLRRFDPSALPAPRDTGATPVPWAVIAETTIDVRARPRFLDYLKKLDGKQVSMTGYMQPINDAFEVSSFLLMEYPIGCWFCETPAPTSLLLVELPAGKSVTIRRGLVKIEGKLKLNSTDPEDFLYSLVDAVIGEVD